MQHAPIAILMATYNGVRYLREQLDSLLSQSYTQWHLYVHDDGSTDGTPDLLQQYQHAHPEQITILEYAPLGDACANFMSLLQRVDAPLCMFCDQDDIWHADKIERSLEQMEQQQALHPNVPIVVASDLRVVDAQGNELAPSFQKRMRIRPCHYQKFAHLVANVATGCTMLLNAEARQAALAADWSRATMHDSWVTLCCMAQGGRLHIIERALIDYRQHADNAIGANDAAPHRLSQRLRSIGRSIHLNRQHYQMMQAAGHISLLGFVASKCRLFYLLHTS